MPETADIPPSAPTPAVSRSSSPETARREPPSQPPAEEPPPPGYLTVVWRDSLSFSRYAALRFYNDNCFQTAAALTYTALLALVPLMTIGFAVFSAFPAFSTLQQQAQQLLFSNLVPTVGDAILEYLSRFMANAGQLTTFGVIGLAVSAVLLLATIESSFSAIWRVREPRPLVTRFLAFWAILTLAPFLFGASLSASTSLLATLPPPLFFDSWFLPLHLITPHLPLILELMGFTLLYLVLPNRTVHWWDAALGGVVAAILLEISKGGFRWYLSAFPAYQTIYGALSTIPIFLLWLYIAWSTVLLGAVVAAAMPEWRSGKLMRTGPNGLLAAQRLAVALAILHELLMASRFGVGMRRRTLVRRVPVGSVVIEELLEQLRRSHWVTRAPGDAWVCTRDLSDATLYDLARAVGVGLKGSFRGVGVLDGAWKERCATLLEQADGEQKRILGMSLKELLADPHDPGPHRSPAPRLRSLSPPAPPRSG